MGDAGIVFDEKNIAEMAETIKAVLDNESLKNEIVERQRERVGEFSSKNVEKKWKEWFE